MTDNKNIIYNQEISTKEKTLRFKIFDYFYYLINDKNKINLFTLYFFHILEIMQLISFAFSYPHILTWKITEKSFYIIMIITSAFRLSPLLRFVSFSTYIIIFIKFFVFIFVFSLLLIIQIIFRNSNSKIYNRLLTFTHISLSPLTIFFYIPILELFLIPLKCGENQIFQNSDLIKCWNGLHFVFIILGILGAIFLFICLFFLNLFYFYPFQNGIINYEIKFFN